MTNRQEIMNQLRTVIVENLEIEVPERLLETDRLYEDLKIDSIMVLQLMVYLEEVFGVTVPEDDFDPAIFQTIGSLTTFIGTLQGDVA